MSWKRPLLLNRPLLTNPDVTIQAFHKAGHTLTALSTRPLKNGFASFFFSSPALFGSVHGVNIADCHSFVLLVCTCISVCPRGRYGHHCAETCSDHCAGADHTCNYVKGSCDQGCDVGYLPPFCNKSK